MSSRPTVKFLFLVSSLTNPQWGDRHTVETLLCSATLFTENRQPPMINRETGESYFQREEEEEEYKFNSIEGIGTPANPWHMLAGEVPLNVILYTFAKNGWRESNIPVLKQWSYNGREAIGSALADTPYVKPGIHATAYTVDPVVIAVLNSDFVKGADFGTAYSYLHHYWNPIVSMQSNLHAEKEGDREMRQTVLINGRITMRHVPPWRVLDLYANRVIPYWVTCRDPWGISHVWVDEKDRIDMMTPINRYEWPVPIPKDANLDLIRIEMLNLGAKYTWLDVLCLQRKGGKGEDLRLEEWKLDMPTIGSVFKKARKVVCYFNGLGRPLHLTTDYFESNWCWFRHAWTLQEIAEDYIIAGDCGDDIMEESVGRRFNKQLKSLHKQHDSIPIYNPHQSPADTWEVLMEALESDICLALLLYYHEPGDGRKCWRPSWEQAMRSKIMVPCSTVLPGRLDSTDDPDTDHYIGYRMEMAYLHGFREVKMEAPPQQGELALKDAFPVPRTVKVMADHAFSIPDGFYTLLGNMGWYYYMHCLIVGRLRDDGKFEKLSVLCLVDDERAMASDSASSQSHGLMACKA
ncbi:hypothetical protein IW261DRAFT_1683933 [Armillaria novae-zelandiae]|uniref:Heterokaryon incompatibility domain-containing protein n=1 Tax=Armillaria novae-zelandiae TaxID=153914 RepID=A0AA39U3U0_9AGAR|nr:hypothetical protein IW261DRAFT_1683933 [Armillaria novae-zelandiae]